MVVLIMEFLVFDAVQNTRFTVFILTEKSLYKWVFSSRRSILRSRSNLTFPESSFAASYTPSTLWHKCSWSSRCLFSAVRTQISFRNFSLCEKYEELLSFRATMPLNNGNFLKALGKIIEITADTHVQECSPYVKIPRKQFSQTPQVLFGEVASTYGSNFEKLPLCNGIAAADRWTHPRLSTTTGKIVNYEICPHDFSTKKEIVDVFHSGIKAHGTHHVCI